MKPGFALNLSPEGIGLLQRGPDGWTVTGEIPLDSTGLAEEMARLRKSAGVPEGAPLLSKLIIPNAQILYTEIDAPGPGAAERRAQIEAALEGLTPYPVAELAYDWSGTGRRVKVAVVAKLTLSEAEGFAEEHGFNPVSFVAIPEPGQFAGEPFFGLAQRFADFLPDGVSMTRDQDPVRILRAQNTPDPEQTPTEQEPVQVVGPVIDTPDQDTQMPAGTSAGPDPDQTRLGPEAASVADPSAAPAKEAGISAGDGAASQEDASIKDASIAADDAALPVAASRATDVAEQVAQQDGGPERSDAPAAPLAVPVTFASTRAGPANTAAESAASRPLPSRQIPHVSAIPPHYYPEQTGAAPSRPAHAPRITITAPAVGLASAPYPDVPIALPGDTDHAAPGAALARLTARAHEASSDAQRQISATASAPTAAQQRAALTAPRRKIDPALFGRLRPADDTGQSRRIGLIAASAAAVAVLTLGAWALIGGGDSAPDEAASPQQVTDASDPARQGQTPAIAQTDAAPAAAGETQSIAAPVPDSARAAADTPSGSAAEMATSPATALAEIEPGTESGAESGAGAPFSSIIDAAVSSALSDAEGEIPLDAPEEVWADAPDTGDAPPTDELARGPEQLTDDPGLDGDALGALSALQQTSADPAVEPQPVPPPFGTVVTFGDDGLIEATEEGTVTPGGFTLYQGRPTIVPPPRPGSVLQEGTEDDASAAESLADEPDPLADSRPRTRPAEVTDRAALPEADLPEAALPEADETSVPVDTADSDNLVDSETPEQVVAAPPADSGTDSSADAAAALDADDIAETAANVTIATAAAVSFADPALAGVKPRVRPGTVTAAAEAQQEAEAQIAAASALAVDDSRRPAARPRDFARAVEAAVAVAAVVPAPQATAQPAPQQAVARVEPEEIDEPEPVAAAPSIPTRASVAKQATMTRAINLGKANLIGVYGSSSNRRALIRLSSGRYVKIKVGDRFDGGQVAAIGDGQMSYVKGGKTHVMTMPRDG